MSLYLQHNETRINSLVHYSTDLLKGGNGRDLYLKFKDEIEKVTPYDAIIIVDRLVRLETNMESLKPIINKILKVFYKSLKEFPAFIAPKGNFLYYLMEENRLMSEKLDKLRPLVRRIHSDNQENLLSDLKLFGSILRELKDFNKHYLRKENILFPYIEKQWSDYRCLSVMWSFHDDIRNTWKKLEYVLHSASPDLKVLNQLTGDLFFLMLDIRFREDYILFPVAFETLPLEAGKNMNQESAEIGYAFIKPPDLSNNSSSADKQTQSVNQIDDNILNMETGELNLEQIKLIFNHLPVDITFIDENNEVRYFSNPPLRIFPRSKAIIGRSVQNCHPPKSLHVVNELVKAFKTGKKDKESFWIQSQGRFLLIQYFALRDKEGKYKGTIEVSQDISEMRGLEGEKRLMDI